MSGQTRFKKILFKISGEAFEEKNGRLSARKLGLIVSELRQLQSLGVKTALVCGAGNIIRGITASKKHRQQADYRGMLATFKNIEALSQALRKAKVRHQIFTSFSVKSEFYPVFNCQQANRAWQKNNIIIIGGGTGYPFFSTDTAAVLRSLELSVELLVKATKVDGVYTADPVKEKKAKKYTTLSYTKFIEQNLKVMDLTAIALALPNRLPIRVIKWEPGNVIKVALGKNLGTIIK